MFSSIICDAFTVFTLFALTVSSVTFMLEHDARNKIATKKLKLDLKKRINTPFNYLKYPDHAGSLTAPFEAGNLNLAPLKVTPAKRPLLPSFIA